MDERGREILRLLQSQNRISVSELVERFGVSEVTARKDLARLERNGQALRIRGGAVLARAVAVAKPIDVRRHEFQAAKALIAQAAVELVKDGETLFIDSGTTMSFLAACLRKRSVRIVTHSLPVIELLQDDDEVAVYVLGGIFNKEARSFSGPQAVAELDRYNFDLAFIGASAISLDGALAAQNVLEAEIKRKALALSHRAIILADSSKLKARAFAVFGRTGDYDCIITDKNLAPEAAKALRATGTELVIVGFDSNRLKTDLS